MRSDQPSTGTRLRDNMSRQAGVFSTLIMIGLLGALAVFGWWAARQIDAGQLERQQRFVLSGLNEIAEQLPNDQDTVAIWNDALSALRRNDQVWLRENLVEWSADFFGHDRIYVLDSADRLVRAVVDQQLVADNSFAQEQTGAGPLIASLRNDMAQASSGLEDSTPAIAGLGAQDFVTLSDGRAVIASVRPIMPFNEALTQRPGTEFIIVSMIYIDEEVLEEISEHFELTGLEFSKDPIARDGAASEPLFNQHGRIVGFFSWMPDQPAAELISRTFWVLLLVVLAAALAMVQLSNRLRRTSVRLQSTEAEAQYLAFHDPLARIPNRALFEDRLDQGLKEARRSGTNLAVFSIDLDHFKRVNDTLGHPAGDELIRQTASRLQAIVADEGTVARLGGDEFAIIRNNVGSAAIAERLAQEVTTSLERPFDLGGHEVKVGASVGVVLVSDSGSLADDIMRQADLALYEAKQTGRGRFCLFAGELDTAVRERRAIELELREALLSPTPKGLELVYQPIFDSYAGVVCGAEALVRWNHPSRGRMSPALFVPLAEERGLIDQLGFWVLREAAMHAVGSAVPWIAVNVSPLQFKDERFADRVLAVLHDVGLHPNRLEIEITEGLLLQNSPVVQATLRQLRSSGIRVALDDFGTGYSSISYLRSHGVDKLKIDQSFVHQLGADSEIESIVRSIIELARAMRMRVTAEGVETTEQQAILRTMGCDQLQGFLLSRPVSGEKLEVVLEDQRSAA